MYAHLINISSPEVFRQYSTKYNIYRNLYESCLYGLEIRSISGSISENVHQHFLKSGIFSYVKNSNDATDLFAMGTLHILRDSAQNIKSAVNEEFGHKINKLIQNFEDYESKTLTIRGLQFPLSQVHIMGILNVTPDSFSDGGKYFQSDASIKKAAEMVAAGIRIIDIGGESTRPGSLRISPKEECDRVIPVIKRISKELPEALISIDTTKYEVAKAALEEGACIINDISGLTFDEKLADLAFEFNAALIVMHIKGTPENMQDNPEYDDVMKNVYDFLCLQTNLATRKKVSNIIIDPGFGFGKKLVDNFTILNRLNEFKGLGFPIMCGISRKSMIGKSLQLEIEDRDTATVIAETIAVKNGARFIRTHNIENAVKLKKLYEYSTNPEVIANV